VGILVAGWTMSRRVVLTAIQAILGLVIVFFFAGGFADLFKPVFFKGPRILHTEGGQLMITDLTYEHAREVYTRLREAAIRDNDPKKAQEYAKGLALNEKAQTEASGTGLLVGLLLGPLLLIVFLRVQKAKSRNRHALPVSHKDDA